MLDSGRQSRMDDARNRFADKLHGWAARFGSVTQLLICVIVVVYAVQVVAEAAGWNGLNPIFALSGRGLRTGFVWQPLSYIFLHASIWHVLINMLMFWFFGREVEYFIGPRSFSRLFFLGGLAGAALWLVFNFNSPAQVIGASAAVLACILAFATLFPERELTLLLFFFIPVTIKAKYMAAIAVAIDLIPVLTHRETGVANLAHLGGAVLGYAYIKWLGYGAMPWWLRWWETAKAKLRWRRGPEKRVLSREEFLHDEVDPILEKISREGMQSLTKRERKILESAKDLMQKQQR